MLVYTEAPSWVPDWTAQSREFGPLPLVLFRPKLYQAATTKTFRSMLVGFYRANPEILDTTKIRTLAVIGGVMDEVTCLSDAQPCYNETDAPSVKDLLAELLNWISAARIRLERRYCELEFKRLLALFSWTTHT